MDYHKPYQPMVFNKPYSIHKINRNTYTRNRLVCKVKGLHNRVARFK